MGSTFVGIGENGFWMRDGILELFLRLAALHLEDPVEDESPVHEIRRTWLLASRGYFGGCVPDGLEAAVASVEGRNAVTAAVESLLLVLQKAPATLDAGVLNLLGTEGEFVDGFETWRLVEVGHAFIDLIEGRVQNTATDVVVMPGTSDTEHLRRARREDRG